MKLRQRKAGLVAAVALVTGAGLVAITGPVAADSCPAEGATARDVKVAGAESHYTISCSGGQVFVNGRVTDTLPGLGCAEVKVQIQDKFYKRRSCSGTKDFNWSGPGRLPMCGRTIHNLISNAIF